MSHLGSLNLSIERFLCAYYSAEKVSVNIKGTKVFTLDLNGMQELSKLILIIKSHI